MLGNIQVLLEVDFIQTIDKKRKAESASFKILNEGKRRDADAA